VPGRDFHPCPERPLIYARGSTAPADRLLFEKVTELGLCQQEVCRLTRERDALARALGRIAAGEAEEPRGYAREVLARLADGELRRV
jgi:hypothetical protein